MLCLVAVGAAAYVFYVRGGDTTRGVQPTAQQESITLLPQEGRSSVTVDSAMFSKGGYVVVRGSDGKRLGQIIEISKYLEAGEHKNITIELGDFYTYNPDDQLIAMIYHDDGDQTFSGLDQPAENTNGNMAAVFVKTAKPVPLSIFQEVTAGSGTGMETIRYTNSGFQPKNLIVPVDTMVEFLNQSDFEMWVASNVHPSHDILPTFDQFKGAAKGKSYMYTFDKKGVWPYHDHNNPSFEGVITVE